MLVAIAASIGNFLQGWDNATIAGISQTIFIFCSFFSSIDHFVLFLGKF